MGLRVFRTVARHRSEDNFRMCTQHGKFDVEGRVEHHIGRLLIREYPLVLSQTDVLPLRDGLLGRIGAFIVVADDTAE